MSAPETELFRAEALAHHARPPSMDVALEREPAWTRWACWGLLVAFAGLIALAAVVRVDAEAPRGFAPDAAPDRVGVRPARSERLLFVLLPPLRALVAGHGHDGR